MVGFNADGPARDRVLKLIEEKDRIESEIRDQTAILETNNVGMDDALVDDQGFPRGDIDVYKVRHARHAIICLQNDHKAIMKRIEQGLAEVHSQFLPQSTNGQSTSSAHLNGNSTVSNGGGEVLGYSENERGFATIAFVLDGSPADLAGLCEHDEILEFGSVNKNNFRDVSQILDIVAHSVGQDIHVLLKRHRSFVNVTVTPRPWALPGLLGCQIERRPTS